MKVKKILGLAISVMAVSGASATFAAEAVPYGWYGEVNVGQSRTTGVTYFPGSSVTENGFGFNLDLGYKFIPYFGAEIGYTSYADASAKLGGVKIAKNTFYSADIAGKGIVPFSDSGFEVFAKLGLAYMHAHLTAPNTVPGVTVSTGKNSSTGLYFALGGDYAFTPNLAANLQWARARGSSNIGNLNLYSVGLNYTFG